MFAFQTHLGLGKVPKFKQFQKAWKTPKNSIQHDKIPLSPFGKCPFWSGISYMMASLNQRFDKRVILIDKLYPGTTIYSCRALLFFIPLWYFTLLWSNAIRETVYLEINVAKMAFCKEFPQLCITNCEDLKVRMYTSSRKVNINNKWVSWYPWIFTSTGVHPCCSRSPNLFRPSSTHSDHMDSSVKMWWVLQDGKVEVGFTLHNNSTYLYGYFDQLPIKSPKTVFLREHKYV